MNGAPAAFGQGGTELVVTPAAALAKGRAITVVVTYGGKPKHVVDPDGSRGGWIRTSDGVINANEPQGAMTWYPGNHHMTTSTATPTPEPSSPWRSGSPGMTCPASSQPGSSSPANQPCDQPYRSRRSVDVPRAGITPEV
ncbi:hypothetical protein AB0K48_52710 [Nonomuraea sp. NPDC055795]